MTNSEKDLDMLETVLEARRMEKVKKIVKVTATVIVTGTVLAATGYAINKLNSQKEEA